MKPPSLRFVQEYYDQRVEEKIQEFTHANPRIEAAVVTIAEWAPAEPRRVLEIGCGIGATSWRMARAWPGATVIGTDVSQASIAVAQRCFHRSNLEYRQGLLADGIVDGSFDLIVLMDVYEHIAPEDRASIQLALRSLLSDDARLILTVPTPAFLGYIADHCPQELQPIDESIGLEQIAALARETATHLVYYREIGVWRYGDYAHLVLARYQSLTDVRLREYRHRSAMARMKLSIKRTLGVEPTAQGLCDYLGTDALRPDARRVQAKLAVSPRERRTLADAWFKRGEGIGADDLPSL